MEKEKQNKQNKPDEEKKEGYIIMPNNFLAEWIRVVGKGPVLLYIQLLTYCHKEKDIAWPSLSTLGDSLDMSKNSLIGYQKTLLKYGLIKKTRRRRTAQGNYRSNLYKVTPMRSPKNGPGQVQNLDTGSPKITLDQVQNLHPNNTNLNSTNLTTTKREKDAVVAAAFKKLKEKGEEKMQAVREQLRYLDFKEEFIEQLLKDYPPRKIEKKLDLLFIKRNIQNPAGWLKAALKDDYQGEEEERYDEESAEQASHLSGIDSRFRGNDKEGSGNDIKGSGNEISRGVWPYAPPSNVPANSDLSGRGNLNSQIPSPLEGEGQGEGDKILSTEEARRRFHLLRQRLMAIGSP